MHKIMSFSCIVSFFNVHVHILTQCYVQKYILVLPKTPIQLVYIFSEDVTRLTRVFFALWVHSCTYWHKPCIYSCAESGPTFRAISSDSTQHNFVLRLVWPIRDYMEASLLKECFALSQVNGLLNPIPVVIFQHREVCSPTGQVIIWLLDLRESVQTVS